METDCAEIKLRATRRIGQISKTLEKAEHGGSGGGSKIPLAEISKREALKSVGGPLVCADAKSVY